MSLRKPPRLASWLLDRFGVASQNPPLTGDLIEEFLGGRSAAWYWRQTLGAVLTGFVRNARVSRRPLVGGVVGWAVDATITFSLLRLRYQHPLPFPPYFCLIALVTLIPLGELFRSAGKAARSRYTEPKSWAAYACEQLIQRVPLHCAFFLFLPVEMPVFALLQSSWLLSAVKDALMPSSTPR